jgi:hypothetical protein
MNGSHEENTCRTPWENIKDKHDMKEYKDKETNLVKGKEPESSNYIVSHCNIGVSEYLFNTAFSFWICSWLLNIGVTCHMTFQRGFFEYHNDNVDGIVHFANRLIFKPSGIGTIKIKFPRIPRFILHDVLYILEM